jgi:hypothetical protein
MTHIDYMIEGAERGDLARLVQTEMHIDEFRSKLGRDEDVCVLSFKVSGKEPALDLVSFIEKGYSWVIDADLSSGEMDDGDFLVFVEIERDQKLAENIISLLSDMMNLTSQDISDWKFLYHKDPQYHEVTEENISRIVPNTADEYRKKYGTSEIDNIKTAAGLPVESRAPKNEYTESIRIAAGIR